MRKVINGVAYDTDHATNICEVTTSVNLVIDGTKVETTACKKLMRMHAPKDGVDIRDIFKPYNNDSSWYMTDTEKVDETKGKFFFLVTIGNRYSSDGTVVPATIEEARDFTEAHADYGTYVRHFGKPEGYDFEKAKDEKKKLDQLKTERSKFASELEATKQALASVNEGLTAKDELLAIKESELLEKDRTIENLSEELALLKGKLNTPTAPEMSTVLKAPEEREALPSPEAPEVPAGGIDRTDLS